MSRKIRKRKPVRECLLLIIFWLLGFPVFAQISIRIDLVDSTHSKDIYLAGNFNEWNAGSPEYKLQEIDSIHKYIVFKVISPGNYHFKFTKGTWGTVESDNAGFDINDREIEVLGDTAMHLSIAGWMDGYFNLTKFPDSLQVIAYFNRSFYFQDRNLDSSYEYALKGFNLAKKIDDQNDVLGSLIMMAQALEMKGSPEKSLELLFQGLPIAESLKDTFHLVSLNFNIGNLFKAANEDDKAKYYYQYVLRNTATDDLLGFTRPKSFLGLGEICYESLQLDSAAAYASKSIEVFPMAAAYLLLGDVERKKGNNAAAMTYFRKAVAIESLTNSTSADMAKSYQRIAVGLMENSQIDSAFIYAINALNIARKVKNPYIIASASSLLSALFESKNKYDSAFFYQRMALSTKDSLFTIEKEKQIHAIVFNDQLHKQELAAERDKLKARFWIYSLLAGLVAFVLASILLIRNIRQKKRANVLLGLQKKQIETSLSDLKATQAQLIQSEKMASLGELTAGIAHEIQNPLNFVNNFSEVSEELLDEMVGELDNGDVEEVKAIVGDLRENLLKINHHGKRADAIVKSMLQHSRTSSGEKELTDINTLCDEYLRLAYLGFRAKDKSFNADFKTEFDPNLPKIQVIPQEIGRVLLNIINNAFQALSSKALAKEDPNYKPALLIGTKKQENQIQITISDNGPGIPDSIKDKIFQPFFTTKPAGQGTGLGLSLAYDIVKAHGGKLKVETKEGEGSEFIIQLPV